MNIGSIGNSLSIRRSSGYGSFSSRSATTQNPRDVLRGLLRSTRSLTSSLNEFRRVLRPGSGLSQAGTSPVALGSDLQLSTEETFAQLESTEEVNAESTSFTPRGPDWSEFSSSEVTIGGEYSGADDDSFKFTVVSGGQVGNLIGPTLEVTDGEGSLVAALTLGAGYNPGDDISVADGISAQFDAGLLVLGDSFSVDVFASVGGVVDPDAAFNGTRNEHAGFENGVTINSGSFTINGTSISVAETDSLNDVLARITASAAGVDASFDSETESVQLTQRTAGPGESISLASDTSGFLSATKLASAILTPGLGPESERTLDSVSAFSGISSGSFQINGQSIAVDVQNDSLQDILERVTTQVDGVTANLNSSTGAVSFIAASGTSLELADGTSSFISELGMTPGTVEGGRARPLRTGAARGRLRSTGATKRLASIAKDLNELFTTQTSGQAILSGARLRGRLGSALTAAADSAFEDRDAGLKILEQKFGLQINTGNTATSDGALEISTAKLNRSINSDAETLLKYLGGKPGTSSAPGFIDGLLSALEEVEEQLITDLDGLGTSFDRYV